MNFWQSNAKNAEEMRLGREKQERMIQKAKYREEREA